MGLAHGGIGNKRVFSVVMAWSCLAYKFMERINYGSFCKYKHSGAELAA
jgi:hypothetical protein